MDDPWSGILSMVIFAMQSTVHTTTQATPMWSVFGHDAIMNLTFNANWHLIKMQKQEAINKNNSKENSKGIQHEVMVNDQVLVMNQQSTKFGQNTYNGPWTIKKLRDKGTVRITKGVAMDVYNIRNITIYQS